VLKEVVEGHDRDRFELIGFSTNLCPGTEFSKSYRASFDRFLDIPNAAPREAARIIHEQEIDVLIDVAGLTGMNCMEIMALRPAPVQAHFLGYSITTGADFMDYVITDRHYIPPEWAEYNTEQLVYMPDTFMAVSHEDPADVKISRRNFRLPKNAFVFTNFNHPCKFEPKIFSAWMDILQAVPNSVMWFGSWAPPTQQNLRREAEGHGVEGKRLIFSTIMDRDKHLARLQLADLALDNLHHGGGITTVDALWVGLPVLSILGDKPGARLGATLLSSAGQEEMITRDLDEYVETAIALAHDSQRLKTIQEKLKADRDTCALFDMARYRRNLENAYEAMWRNHEAGNPPKLIDLASWSH
jgi:predicted O-linked N-acetylglucosamine transferase (SPINDLY family)